MARQALATLLVWVGFMIGCSGATRPGAGSTGGGAPPPGDATAQFTALRDRHVAQFRDLERQWSLAWWDASLSGRDEDFQRAQDLEIAVRRLHSDRQTFAQLRELRASGQVTDPVLRRSLEALYLAFEQNQIDDELMRRMVELQSDLEQEFNTYRPTVDGAEVRANEIRDVLQNSDDSERRRVMWQASKEIGPRVAARLAELARMRNQAARGIGYASYYEMQLRGGEQDPEEIRRIFDELATMTEEPFRQAKAELDARLARRFGVPVDQLMPWHYADPYFQESPGVGIDLDPMFASHDPREVATAFFHGIGLPIVDEILARSDLYERDGKVEHAFCTHIDREGDVRVLTNLQNNERWTGTLLHELGHGVYDAHIDREVPYELREPAHTFTTEGIAELFGMLTRDPAWLRQFGTVPADAPANLDEMVRADHRLDLLIFARWSLVMVNFERELYANPDQDLNALWWRLVQQYQGLRPPPSLEGRADYAAKIHIVTVPAYYHNYMLGRMYQAQLRHRLATEIPGLGQGRDFQMTGHPEVGQYLIENVFRPGALHAWPEFVTRSTGEPLTARYFAEELR